MVKNRLGELQKEQKVDNGGGGGDDVRNNKKNEKKVRLGYF